jgi:uncharacterized protein (TIGR02599 family)
MPPGRAQVRGFSLVELLVAIAILGLILILVASQIDLTSKTYKRTVSKMEEYRSARLGFEAMSRRLTQATLNSYLDLVDSGGNPPTSSNYNGTPSQYARQSELRFICGNSFVPTTVGSGIHPTHSVFFCAPLGVADGFNSFTGTGTDQGLEQLLNVCGYYIEFSKDTSLGDTPSFFPTGPDRWRFRLMEMVESSESIDIYTYTTGQVGTLPYAATTWFTDGLPTATTNPGFTHALADNVVALIILPRLSSEQETQLSGNAGSLAPGYAYDSTSALTLAGLTPSGQTTYNQLPPLLQITMVAIDETSAVRLQAQFGAGTAPGLTTSPTNLFTSIATINDYQNDLSQLEANLQQSTVNGKTPAIHLTAPVSYRVFTSNIRITGARWSTDQNN